MRNPNPDADRGGLAVADRGAGSRIQLHADYSVCEYVSEGGVRMSVRGLILRVDLALVGSTALTG